MCILLSEGDTSNTLLYTYRRLRQGDDIYGYGFTPVQDPRIRNQSKGNALMIGVPLMPGTTLGPENLIDTTDYRWLPEAMIDLLPKAKSGSRSMAPESLDFSTVMVEFNEFSVVFATGNANAINEALAEVSRRHHDRQMDLLSGVQVRYMNRCFAANPNLTFVCACWAMSHPDPGFFMFRYTSALHNTPWQLHYAEDSHKPNTPPDQLTHVSREQIAVTAIEGVTGDYSLDSEFADRGLARPDWLAGSFTITDLRQRHGPNGNWVFENNGTKVRQMYRSHHPVTSIS